MKTEHHRWHSPALGKAMDILVFGHGGAKLLVFPTSMGTFTEWADRRMHEVLRDHIEQGWIQMFCVDQVNSESWNADTIHPGHRAWRHLQYDAYLEHEVAPFMDRVNSNPYVIATGASLGAYQAAVYGMRHPHLVQRIIGMSGLYDIKRLTGGYSDENVYRSNPMDFIPNEQDPAFAFRVIVDIASKALSPAINDPTTAVLALDQLHHLLRKVGIRKLDAGLLRDRDGRLRLVYRTPDWEDFVELALTEIRHFGASSVQVARRLRALLVDLIVVLPPERHAALRSELRQLQRAVARAFEDPEDRARAERSDSQGIGGHERHDASALSTE